MSDCVGCGAIIPCPDLPDSVLYSLQNQTFPYVLNCPPGYNCQPQSTIYFQCCTQLIHVDLPTNPTSAQITAALNQLATQCIILESACGGIGFVPGTNVQLYWNTPQSCTVLCPDGIPFTYDVPAGVVVGTSQAKANSGALTLACNLASEIRICLTQLFLDPLNLPCTGRTFSETIRVTTAHASNFNSQFAWTITAGTLPGGLSLAANNPPVSATISGTFSTAGTFNFTITCTVTSGPYGGTSVSKPYSITVPSCVPCSFSPAAGALPGASMFVAYSETFTDTGGLGAPVVWTWLGTLPTGLNLNSSTGVLSGTPTVGGPFTFAIIGTGTSKTCQQGYSITVASALTIDSTTVTALSNNSFPSSGCGTFNNQLINYPGGFPQTDPFNPAVIFGPPAWAQYSSVGSAWIVLWYSSVGDGTNGPGYYIGCTSCPNGLYDLYFLTPQSTNPRGTYNHSGGFSFPGFPSTITVS